MEKIIIIDNIKKRNIELEKINNNSWYNNEGFNKHNIIKYVNYIDKYTYNVSIITEINNNFEIKGNYIIKKNEKSNNINKEK